MHGEDRAGSRTGACIYDAALGGACDAFRGSMQIIPNKVIINNYYLSSPLLCEQGVWSAEQAVTDERRL